MAGEGKSEWGRSASQVAIDLIFGRYPAGIYGRMPAPDEMPPIFGFHSVRALAFEGVLRFLAENGYQTLSCDQYVDWMQNGRPAGTERSLLLTFDDGMASVYTVAWPLLRKYGMGATVFLIPGIIQDRGTRDPHSRVHSVETRNAASPAMPGPTTAREVGGEGAAGGLGPTLEDVWTGRISLAELEAREDGDAALCTWAEIRSMHESGVIEFEAHTMSHNLVFTGTDPTNYVSPTLIRSLHPNRLTMWEHRRRAYRPEAELGAPLFTTAPRMSEARRVVEDPELRRVCVEYVAAHGAASFFENPDWKKDLDWIASRHRRQHGLRHQLESEEDKRKDLYEDLAETKSIIENRLPGRKVRHLAYPWGIGSDLAVQVSHELGYVSNHWGRVEGRVRNRRGDDPFRIARIGEDFLPLLPGTGRTSLSRVIRKKLAKNLKRLFA